MKKYKINVYDDTNKHLFSIQAIRIDICDSHSIIYMSLPDSYKENTNILLNAEKFTVRLIWQVKTITIILGEILIYYVNGCYMSVKNG